MASDHCSKSFKRGNKSQDEADTSVGTPHRNIDRHQWALNNDAGENIGDAGEARGKDPVQDLKVLAYRERLVRRTRGIHDLLPVFAQKHNVGARRLAGDDRIGLATKGHEVPGGESAGHREDFKRRDSRVQLIVH